MNMQDEALRNHLALQSKRLDTYALVRAEVYDVTQARAAAGFSPMIVDALTKGHHKGGGKKGGGKHQWGAKGSGKKGGRGKGKKGGAPASSSKKCFYCDRVGPVRNDCQERAADLHKVQAAGRPFVDRARQPAASGDAPVMSAVTAETDCPADELARFVFALEVETPAPREVCAICRPPTALATHSAG